MKLTLAKRFSELSSSPWHPALVLRAGRGRDYEALAEHHYLSQRPATITRVLVLEYPGASIAERWARQVSSFGFSDESRCWGRRVSSCSEARGGGACLPDVSCSEACAEGTGLGRAPGPTQLSNSKLETRNSKPAVAAVAAVLVESLPALNCALRDVTLPGRYTGWTDIRQRARLLNSEIRCISRVIVDPRFRSLGLARRLVAAALQSATTPYTEALAAMGHVNPFFAQAGMHAYHRPGHPFDERLKAALAACALGVGDLARLDTALMKVDALPVGRRRWLLAELGTWGRRTRSFEFRVGAAAPLLRPSSFEEERSRAQLADLLRVVRRKLLRQPVYYLWAKAAR